LTIFEKIRKWFLKAKEKAQQALSKTRFTQELKDLGGIYTSKLARVLSRHYDDVPAGVKTVEKVIAEQEYEFAAIFRNGKLEGKLISSGKEGSVMFEDALLAKMKNAVVTHNHPAGGSLSPADIKLFLKVGMKEVRAKCPDGSVFSLKNKGVRLGNKEADNIIKKIKNELEISYGGISDKIIKQRFEADLLMKELKSRFGDKIDYIHYK